MTIKDIARLSGYAVGTVSRVLNDHPNVSDAARERILAVVEEQNFKLNSNAKHLKQNHSSGVAIIIKGSGNMLFAAIVEHIQALIRDSGHPSMVYYLGEDGNEVEQALLVCRERRPLGILFLGSNLELFRAQFQDIQVPCVLVTNSAESLGFPNLSSVSTDDAQAARQAVLRLMDLGHREIGILGGFTDMPNAARTRLQGVQAAFRERGRTLDLDRHYEAAYFSMPCGYEAMLRLLDRVAGLTAVFAMSDVQAIGALRALRDRGLRVPEDISVTGFDGIALGEFVVPRLTTVRQDEQLLARRSVALLLQHIQTGTGPVHELVPYAFVPGESTGPAPAGAGRRSIQEGA